MSKLICLFFIVSISAVKAQQYLYVEFGIKGDRNAMPRAIYIPINDSLTDFDILDSTSRESLLSILNSTERYFVHADLHYLLTNQPDSITSAFEADYEQRRKQYKLHTFQKDKNSSLSLAIVDDIPISDELKFNAPVIIPRFVYRDGVLWFIEENTKEVTIVYTFKK